MKVKKLIEMEYEMEFGGLTLLSAEEYSESREFITLLNGWWWLCSPSYRSNYASAVNGCNNLDDTLVSGMNCAVRPALILKSSNLLINDKFRFYNHNWTVISDKYALCDEAFRNMAFRNDWKTKYSNIYEVSDIKKYLDLEWINIKNSNQDKD